MTDFSRTLVAAAALAVAAGSAWAAPVLLGTVTHDYGSAAGRVAPTSQGIFPGGCDTVNTNSLTVRWQITNNCNRFHDVFDFSGLGYETLDRLVLTVNFAGTNNTLETWRVRPASNQYETQVAGSALNMASVGAGGTSQDFTFDAGNLSWMDTHNSVAGQSIFDNVADSGRFFLWFASAGLIANQTFTLNSVSLQVWGTPAPTNNVPVPGTLALVGLGALAMGLVRRRKA